MLRWGAVGVGTFFEGAIAPAMAADPNSVLAAVVSRDAGRAEGVASRWGATGFYTMTPDLVRWSIPTYPPGS